MLFRRSVDSIVANITKQVEQLHDAATRHHNDAAAHSAAASQSEARASLHSNERDRARGIAQKLKDLIS